MNQALLAFWRNNREQFEALPKEWVPAAAKSQPGQGTDLGMDNPLRAQQGDTADGGEQEQEQGPSKDVPPELLRYVFSSFRTRITTCYSDRVETGPDFVPVLRLVAAHSRRYHLKMFDRLERREGFLRLTDNLITLSKCVRACVAISCSLLPLLQDSLARSSIGTPGPSRESLDVPVV